MCSVVNEITHHHTHVPIAHTRLSRRSQFNMEHMNHANDEDLWKGLEQYKDNRNAAPPRWIPESFSVEMLLHKLKKGTLNVNPPHQRDVVHNDVWKATIISSVFETGCIPETFWHRTPGKRHHYDSVDGKQRCCAFRDYVDGKFKWKKRYFHELPEELQFRILEFKITVNKADRTLTDEELRETFNRFQVTKETKLGEQWNADACELRTIMQAYVEKDEQMLDDKKLLTITIPNRHPLLELYGTLFSYYILGDVASTKAIIVACWAKHRNVTSRPPNGPVQWELFRTYLSDMWTILERNIPCPKKRTVKTRARPLFGLLLHLNAEHRADVVEHLKTSLIQHEKKYPKVNGNHSAHLTRMEQLKESVQECFPGTTIYKS